MTIIMEKSNRIGTKKGMAMARMFLISTTNRHKGNIVATNSNQILDNRRDTGINNIVSSIQEVLSPDQPITLATHLIVKLHRISNIKKMTVIT